MVGSCRASSAAIAWLAWVTRSIHSCAGSKDAAIRGRQRDISIPVLTSTSLQAGDHARRQSESVDTARVTPSGADRLKPRCYWYSSGVVKPILLQNTSAVHAH